MELSCHTHIYTYISTHNNQCNQLGKLTCGLWCDVNKLRSDSLRPVITFITDEASQWKYRSFKTVKLWLTRSPNSRSREEFGCPIIRINNRDSRQRRALPCLLHTCTDIRPGVLSKRFNSVMHYVITISYLAIIVKKPFRWTDHCIGFSNLVTIKPFFWRWW